MDLILPADVAVDEFGLRSESARLNECLAPQGQFTKDAIEKLKCPEGKSDVLVYDNDEKGLAVRVTKAGVKTFFMTATFMVQSFAAIAGDGNLCRAQDRSTR